MKKRHLLTCQFTTKPVQNMQTGQVHVQQVVASTVVDGSVIEWYQSECWRITFPKFDACTILNCITEECAKEASDEVKPTDSNTVTLARTGPLKVD